MKFSTEPTRELLFCTTSQSEPQLQEYFRMLPGREGGAARTAIVHPSFLYAAPEGVARFWDWNASNAPEHPLVAPLLSFVASLPESQFRLLRITCDDNELEAAGDQNLLNHLHIGVISAPRIVF